MIKYHLQHLIQLVIFPLTLKTKGARTTGHQRTTFATSKKSTDFSSKIYQQINSNSVKKTNQPV